MRPYPAIERPSTAAAAMVESEKPDPMATWRRMGLRSSGNRRQSTGAMTRQYGRTGFSPFRD